MAFDVYVGGFSRYYAREWENVAQKWARENNTGYRMIGPDGEPQAADWDQVTEIVSHWRAAINNGIGKHLDSPIDWDESRDAPYFTDRPGYDAYGALLVWAAHAEAGTEPPTSYNGEWYSDETFLGCSVPKQGQKYRPITCGSLWLPGEFEFSFDFEDLTHEKVHICSNHSLLRSLDELNQNTFQLDSDQMAVALEGESEKEEPTLATLARFGLALFHSLAEQSVQHQLPIRLST
ncbi:hypothetical protein [Bremerella sp.]|uniref:hypothetical protein n=1 Tax=Bremerella sp. TaxID=2795602 RepID=UPI00391C69D1